MPTLHAETVRAWIEDERERFRVPGCAVAVVVDGEVVIAEGVGSRDLERSLPVTERTLFAIGSSTKTFTAALCAALVADGLLEWDRPLREYLPGFRMHDPVATEQLTVRDCLSHRSGLPRHDVIWYTGEGRLTRDDLVEVIRHLEPNRPFRDRWQYNNLLYTIAGHLAGRLLGGSYEEAVRTRLLAPLGMERTNFTVEDTERDADHARPYALVGDAPAKPVPYARLALAGPAGNINACIAEMVPWLLTLLGRGVGDNPPLLPPDVLDEMRTPIVPLPRQSPVHVGTPVGYGLGQLIEDYRGHRVVHHGGNIDGFSTMVAEVPDAGIGVVVLSNAGATALRDVLPYRVFDHVLGLSPRPHGEVLHARQATLEAGAEQAKARRAESRRPLPAVRPLADYAGRYEHPAYGTFEVVDRDAGLAVEYHGITGARLEHRHLEVFDLVFEAVGEEQRTAVQFGHDLDGDVDGARVALEPAAAPIRFARVRDVDASDEVLDALAGRYAMGPITAAVTRRGDRELVVSVDGGDPLVLEPKGDGVFTVGGATVEFADDGTLRTPYGDFTRAE